MGESSPRACRQALECLISSSRKPRTSSTSLARSPPQPSVIEYMSTAPQPPSGKHAQKDEDVPEHLYAELPEHFMRTDGGRRVPDYLRMILMCEWARCEC